MVLVSVENKGAYCCLTAWRAGHSKIMCISSATATLPQCVQTLLALATRWPPAKRPRTIGNWWEPSLNCRNRRMRLPETGSWQYRLCWLKGLNQWWYVHATTPTEGAALGQCRAWSWVPPKCWRRASTIVPTSRTGIAPLSRGMGCPTECKPVAMEPEKFLAPFPTEKA